MNTTAYNAGHAASLDGAIEGECPYVSGTPSSSEWRQGFADAQIVKRQRVRSFLNGTVYDSPASTASAITDVQIDAYIAASSRCVAEAYASCGGDGLKSPAQNHQPVRDPCRAGLEAAFALAAPTTQPTGQAVEPSQPAESVRLRQIISECAAALGNGSGISPECSVEFMSYLPEEIRAVVASRTPAPAAPSEDAKQMTLGELEMALRPLADDLVFPEAFGAPASYRGYYEELAFRPEKNKTVRELKAHVEAGYGAFRGYKGGTYSMEGKTLVNIAAWGDCGPGEEDQFTDVRFKRMLAAAIAASTKAT